MQPGWLTHIAQRQRIGIRQILPLATMFLDQQPAGAGIADIEDEIDRDWLIGQIRRHGIDQPYLRQLVGPRQQLQKSEVARVMFAAIRKIRRTQGAITLLAQKAAEQIIQPFTDPRLIQKPAHRAEIRHEAKLHLLRGILAREGQINIVGAGAQCRIEDERQIMRGISRRFRAGGELGTDPVAGALLIGEPPIPVARRHGEIGQRHPAVQKRLQRLGAGDGIGVILRHRLFRDRVGERTGSVHIQRAQLHHGFAIRIRCAGRHFPKAAAAQGGLREVEADIPELQGGIRHQRDQGWHGPELRCSAC